MTSPLLSVRLIYLSLFCLMRALPCVLDFSSRSVSKAAHREGAALTPPWSMSPTPSWSYQSMHARWQSSLLRHHHWKAADSGVEHGSYLTACTVNLYFSAGHKVKMIIILIERAWETLRRQNIIIQTGNCQVVPILVGSSSDHREWSRPQFKVSAQVCIKHFYIKSINMYVLNIIFEILRV